MQKYTSEKTSRNQIAQGFKKIQWKPGTINLDIGGGAYDKATNYLFKEHHVLNMIYDPYCRSAEYNKVTVNIPNRYNTCTIFNTLNVIEEEVYRVQLLKTAKVMVRHLGIIYITVYEGDQSGIGKPTRDGYQMNRKLKEYLSEINEIFPCTECKNGVITCINTNE